MSMNESDCPMCGKPRGTGTLLDAKPEPPAPAKFSRDVWRGFAERYRCPACNEHDVSSVPSDERAS